MQAPVYMKLLLPDLRGPGAKSESLLAVCAGLQLLGEEKAKRGLGSFEDQTGLLPGHCGA